VSLPFLVEFGRGEDSVNNPGSMSRRVAVGEVKIKY
jgi:hypothetical protein